jgi:hypothetical protein
MLTCQTEPDANGKRIVVCSVCKSRWNTAWPPERIRHKCIDGNSLRGVGAELKKIFSELGVSPTSACQCDAKAREWNANGVEWCQSHRAEIIAHLQSAYTHATLATKAQAFGAALWHGYPLTLDGILDLAIERSRKAPQLVPENPEKPQ